MWIHTLPEGFPGGSEGKESACIAGDLGKIWRREWQLTPVLLPGEVHGQKQAPVHGVAKSHTRLNDQHFHTLFPALFTEGYPFGLVYFWYFC